jgi:cyclopropane-fatty-acyl-phospholipid synthase
MDQALSLFTPLLNYGMADLIREGWLELIGPDGRTTRFGVTDGLPHAAVRIHDEGTIRQLVFDPELALGEAYMDGRLTLEPGTSLRDLLELLTLNAGKQGEPWLDRLKKPFLPLVQRWQQYNPPWKSLANVAHHYDLSDALYSRFLDSDRQYSCAYFMSPDDTLEIAQKQKKRHIAAKLAIEPGMHVLDIGSGWGGLGIYLAQECGARVTGITLSREQLGKSRERAEAAGVADRVNFVLRDYREVEERFDRVVSVGMFEHVGVAYYNLFFRKIRDLLTEDGVALVHSIGRPEGPGDTSAWLRKYIFPGGYAPALSETLPGIERSGLLVSDIEILRLHYAMTLQRWHENFAAKRDEIASIYDERFCRMWEFYLLGAEMEFRNMGLMNVQIQLQRKQTTLPLQRDYMLDRERQMALG